MSGFPTWGSDIGGYDAPPGDTPSSSCAGRSSGRSRRSWRSAARARTRRPWTLGAGGDGRRSRGRDPPLRALPVPLRPPAAPPARPAAARLRLSGRPEVVGARPTSSSSAPTCSPRRSTGAGTTPSVYLPPGSWVDLYTGTIVTGAGRRSRGRPRSPSSRSTPAPARSSRSTCARGPAPGGASTSSPIPGRAGFLATNGADARPRRPAARRAALRPGRRHGRAGDARREAGAVDLERRAAPGRRDPPARTGDRGGDRRLADLRVHQDETRRQRALMALPPRSFRRSRTSARGGPTSCAGPARDPRAAVRAASPHSS